MKILAVSDLRTQPMYLLAKLIEREKPDLVLYGGDDVDRLGPVPDGALVNVAAAAIEAPEITRGSRASLATGGVFVHTSKGCGPESLPRELVKSSFRLEPADHIVVWAVPVRAAKRQSLDRAGLASLLGLDPDRLFSRRAAGAAWWMWVEREELEEDPLVPALRAVPYGLAGVLGNDDRLLYETILVGPGRHNLHWNPLLLDEVAIIGLQGAPPEDGPGGVRYSEEGARTHLQRQLAQVGQRPVILVSHAPPYKMLDLALRFGVEHIGSQAVRELVDTGRLLAVVCGHVHSRGGRYQRYGPTWVVNIASHDEQQAPLRYAILDVQDGRCASPKLSQVRHRMDGLPFDCTTDRIWGIGSVLAKKLFEGGFSTAESVSEASIEDLHRVLGRRPDDIQRQAQALVHGKPVLVPKAPAWPENLLLLDVETSVDQKDDPWLICVKVFGQVDLVQIETLDPRRLGDQLERLDQALSIFPDMLIATWSGFDRAAIGKAFDRIGQCHPSWLAPERWWDALTQIRRRVALPLEDYQLGTAAEWSGFTFRHPDLDGLTVGSWYAQYRDTQAPFDVERVREYNQDDVHAIEAILNRVRGMTAS